MAKLQGGTKAQIAAVLEAGLMPKIIDALANADFDVKKVFQNLKCYFDDFVMNFHHYSLKC